MFLLGDRLVKNLILECVLYCVIFHVHKIRCGHILCYLFVFEIIMFMGGIYYNLCNFFSIIILNMYISSCMTCLYVYKLKNKV